MNLRDLILNNFGWKLLSLALAALTWSLIHFDAKFKGVQILPPGQSFNIDLPAVPIRVHTRPDDTNRYAFHPTTAHLVLSGNEEVLKRIERKAEGLVDVYLDLANTNFDRPAQVEVRVRRPDGVSLVSVVPSHLMVRKHVPEESENPTE